MTLSQPPVSTWDEAPAYLLDLALRDLTHDHAPLPSLVAFSGADPVAIGVLRPFDADGPVPALVEVLALLLPLGTDRVALTLPGRAWSTADPIPPVCEDGDLRQQVLVLVQAEASTQGCTVRTQLRAIEPDGTDATGWQLSEPLHEDGFPEAPLIEALRLLLERRDDLRGEATGQALVAQLGRVLLLGHTLALAPEPTERLVRASAA